MILAKRAKPSPQRRAQPAAWSPLQRGGHRIARLAVANRLDEGCLTLVDLVEEQVLLGREVVEDGLLRDTCRRGDLGDGNVIEAALHEHSHRGVRDQLPRLELLGLAQTHGDIVPTIVTFAEIF